VVRRERHWLTTSGWAAAVAAGFIFHIWRRDCTMRLWEADARGCTAL
jgi:hypothetical protein